MNFHHFVQHVFTSANSCQAAVTKSKILASVGEVRPLTFRGIQDAQTDSFPLSVRARRLPVSSESPPSEIRGEISAGSLYRGRCFRCIDPSDVQSLRLISAVPAVGWRRYCSALSQAVCLVESQHHGGLLSHHSHTLKKPAHLSKKKVFPMETCTLLP